MNNPRKKSRSISMHADVEVWCDCCSCEAEPYWQAVADELGIDLDSPAKRNPMPLDQAADENG